MILGILDSAGGKIDLGPELLRQRNGGARAGVWANGNLALCAFSSDTGVDKKHPGLYVSSDQAIVVACRGRIHNSAEIERLLRSDRGCGPAEALGRLYESGREDWLGSVNGQFAFALWDARRRRLLLGRDRLGIESLFYWDDGARLVFGSSLRAMLATGWVAKELNHDAVAQYLLYCYNPGQESFVRRAYKLPPGHLLVVENSHRSLRRYWRLSFADVRSKTEARYREEILNLIEDAIRIRLDPHGPPGVLLSGGTDSSAIVSLASRMAPEPLRTFSFCCEGRSYDESPYARFVARRYGTNHTEIAYGPDCLFLVARAVESMDEPFCDIGIEIGTYLLGQAARGNVSCVLSGEGGDELFAGHPVYVADKVAAAADRLPRMLVHPVARILQRIPDSDRKKNIQVKLKRLAYGLSFPPELLSHRWRVYYTPAELHELCAEGFLGSCDLGRLFEPMIRHASDADGKDLLSRSLYSDYGTLVDFYLRRLGLLKAHGVESRTPLLDHRLVEYAATIPSALKIRKMSETKYIYRRILEGVVPAEILHHRPKLGHSVPMKNWLREDPALREWIGDVLGNGVGPGQGFFRPAAVRRMVDEHLRKSHNHSHRLWGLLVLEKWLADVFGASGAPARQEAMPAILGRGSCGTGREAKGAVVGQPQDTETERTR